MNTGDRIEVVADDREAGSGVVDILASREDVSVRVERLALGDYRIDGRLLVERKTLPDLVGSIRDGRLFTQGCRLADTDLWTAVVLEGTGGDLARIGMRREAIQGALISLTLYLGIPLLRSRSKEETVRLMLYAARQGRAVAGGPQQRAGRQPRGKLSIQTRVLQGLPGVGPKRARQLLDRFGDLESVMSAGVSELASVNGIGRSTAQAIRWAVKDAPTFYEESADDLPDL